MEIFMCDCVKKTNALLAQYNTRLVLPMIGPQRVLIETTKADNQKRGKPASMFASFCPFCGERYQADQESRFGVAA